MGGDFLGGEDAFDGGGFEEVFEGFGVFGAGEVGFEAVGVGSGGGEEGAELVVAGFGAAAGEGEVAEAGGEADGFDEAAV